MPRVLHVDDSQYFLDLLRLLLEESFSEIELVSENRAMVALELLTNQHFDVVLCDYEMPDLDGLGFLEAMNKAKIGIPFIILSGKGDKQTVIKALNMGARYYFEKTPDIDKLIHTLGSVISDLTRLVASEKALKLNEEKFRKVFMLNPTSLVINRLSDGLVVDVNDVALQLMDIEDRSYLVGKTVVEAGLMTEVDRLRGLELWEEKIKGVDGMFEAPLYPQPNGYRVGLFKCQEIELLGERYIIQAGREITEEKQLENALQALLNSSTTPLLLTNSTGRIIAVNEALHQTFTGKKLDVEHLNSLLGINVKNLVAEVKEGKKEFREVEIGSRQYNIGVSRSDFEHDVIYVLELNQVKT